MEKKKQLGHGKILKLKQNVRTRWNSSLFMIERLGEIKRVSYNSNDFTK